MREMYTELEEEFRTLFTSENYAQNIDFHMDLCTGEIFRVDEDKSNLTDSDLAQYPDQVREADRKELNQFLKFNVFKKKHFSRLPKGSNLVDCTWIRVWKKGKVKSRLCARGCFDNQKQLIEKHSSTATRLSQRIIMSQFMIDGLLYQPFPGDPITLISLDISGAFLQGLEYEELIRISRELGYETRNKREVYITPQKTFGSIFGP